MSKNNAKKMNLGQIVYMVVMLGAGMVCGLSAGALLGRAKEQGVKFWQCMLVLFVGIYAAMFIQIIVHEMGHLVFGLATGYKFSSFRIGNLMFLKEDGKIKLRKFSITGTAGQCLMSPPDLVDGKMPVVLYNFGGCIFNLIISAVFAICAYVRKESPLEFIFYVCFIILGIAFALLNGIPMKVGPISNDGHNALSLGKEKEAMRAFWLQLKINEEQSKGKRLKEMPEEWFAVPENLDNALVASLAVFHENWLMDQLKIEEVAEYIEQLLSKDSELPGLYKSLMTCDRIYCELVVKKNISEAIVLHNKEHEAFVKQMKNYPSVIRTEYVYALLAKKDEEKAKKWMERFEKVEKTYPYPREMEGERELIEKAR